MSLTVGSLCSGYEGIGLGLGAVLPTELAWYAEFDDAPAKIMAHHHPDATNYRDLTSIDWHSLPKVDIVTAGFPCQPFSGAGLGLGANDPRHLWPYIQEGMRVLRPRLGVFENVRGLLSAQGETDTDEIENMTTAVTRWNRALQLVAHKQRKAALRGQEARIERLEADRVRLVEQRDEAVGAIRRARKRLVRALGAVVGGLADIGYDSWWIGFRAADVGAAHGRFRVFVFAQPADADLAGLEGLADSARAAQARRHGHAVEGAGGSDLTLLPTPAVNDMGAAYTPETWDAWTATEGTGAGAHGTGGDNLRTVASLLPTPRATDGTKGGPNQRGSSGDLMLPSAVQKMLPTPAVADVQGGRKARSGERGDELLLNGIAASQDWREYEAAIRRQETAFGRPAPLPTELGAKGQPRLSPAFVEWLMGLPEGWVTDVPGISRNDQLKALGNGVVPQQCAAAVRAFLSDMTKEQAA